MCLVLRFQRALLLVKLWQTVQVRTYTPRGISGSILSHISVCCMITLTALQRDAFQFIKHTNWHPALITWHSKNSNCLISCSVKHVVAYLLLIQIFVHWLVFICIDKLLLKFSFFSEQQQRWKITTDDIKT